MSRPERTKFTVGERSLAAVGLVIALLGQINSATWQRAFFGLTEKQMAMLSFVPLALIAFYILRRPDPRSAK